MIKNKYLYTTVYKEQESSMAKMELNKMFNQVINSNIIISDLNIDVNRSVFIKAKMTIKNENKIYDELVKEIELLEYYYDDYKVVFLKHQYLDLDYEKRLEKCKEIGYHILGDFSLYQPTIEFAITVYENKWYFGKLEKNDISWQKHLDKPENFSNSLPIRVARTIVNIATGNNKDLKLVDPCCGVGTVLLEAYELGYNIEGYDISYRNVEHTRKNINYYKYDISCTKSDIKDISKHYDVAIIDLPYDLYAKISYKEQYSILKNSYNICDKLVLVTNSDNRKELEEIGYKNIEMSYVIKQQFKRYIFVAYH